MIEDKEKGTLIAENPTEAIWWTLAKESKETIKMLHSRIKRAENELKMSALEIEKKFKDGAKGSIANFKDLIIIQEEILKLAEGKVSATKNLDKA